MYMDLLVNFRMIAEICFLHILFFLIIIAKALDWSFKKSSFAAI